MDIVRIPYQYLSSLWYTSRDRELFSQATTYVLFIGYPRSGHTLVGFLIDAHPEAVIASQTSILRYLRHGFSPRQAFYCILENSRKVARIGREWRPYSYAVPNQWQGRFDRLRVIGDCTGLSRVRKNPRLLETIRKRLPGIDLKLIHVIRNPYDNISTMTRVRDSGLRENIDVYFSMCQVVERIQEQVGPGMIYSLRHEDLIADPKATLQGLCGFLGLSAEPSYYDDCAGIIFKSPRKTRKNMPWTPELIAAVQERANKFPFLAGYSYDD
jgi:hypothetical protein